MMNVLQYCCVKGTWVWSDGTTLDYTNWGSGYPDGGNCTGSNHYAPDPTWDDYDCTSTKFYYVCKL